MSSVPKNLTGEPKRTERRLTDKQQLRRDRIAAIAILAVIAALMALVIWAAGASNGSMEQFNGYWPRMP